jgi:hypothetical protein
MRFFTPRNATFGYVIDHGFLRLFYAVSRLFNHNSSQICTNPVFLLRNWITWAFNPVNCVSTGQLQLVFPQLSTIRVNIPSSPNSPHCFFQLLPSPLSPAS